MCFGMVRDLVTRTRHEPERATVAQLRLELAAETEEDVSLLAPMIRTISLRIFDHAHAHESEQACAPARDACFSAMLGDLEGVPVRRAEWNVVKVHVYLVKENELDASKVGMCGRRFQVPVNSTILQRN